MEKQNDRLRYIYCNYNEQGFRKIQVEPEPHQRLSTMDPWKEDKLNMSDKTKGRISHKEEIKSRGRVSWRAKIQIQVVRIKACGREKKRERAEA